jgi:hypothetical protein
MPVFFPVAGHPVMLNEVKHLPTLGYFPSLRITRFVTDLLYHHLINTAGTP